METEVAELIVYPPSQPDGGGGDCGCSSGGNPGDPPGGWSGEDGGWTSAPQGPVDCTDNLTDKSANIRAEQMLRTDLAWHERGSVLWRNAQGAIVASELLEGSNTGVDFGDLSQYGITSYAQVVGIVHSHPENIIQGETWRPATIGENVRWSGADVAFLDFLVDHGANASDLRMYVVSPMEDMLYEYDYGATAAQRGTMTAEQRSNITDARLSDPYNPSSDSRCS